MRRHPTPIVRLLAPLLVVSCSAPTGLDGTWRVSSIAAQPYPALSEYGTASIERSWSMVLVAAENAPVAAEGTMTWRERYSFHGGGELHDVLREFTVELRERADASLELTSWPETGGAVEPLPPQLVCEFIGEDMTAPLRCVDEQAREWLWERD